MTQPNKPHTVHIETFGCQMNEYDSELVRSLLRKAGFEFTEDRERADVMLMNTCAIRENAHNKVYGHLAELKAVKAQRPLVVGVLGCMAQNLKEELTEKQPLVDVLVGPDGYRQLPGLLAKALTTEEEQLTRRGLAVDLSEYETYDDILPERDGGVNAWIAIMRGCDNFCSFCVVPYTRGRERSRNPEGILREVEASVASGHTQITLLGQNVNSYHNDDWDFARLILAVAEVPGVQRVRFTSPHPKDFPPALLDAVAGHPNICKHIHLPLQSGNDRILELMNRTYSRKEYLDLAATIRHKHPGIALTTDIICGFCSETEEEFLDTYRVVDEGAHVYSQHRVEVDTRPGTAQSYILTVLQAHDAGATPLSPTVAEDATSFTVSLNGATAITFAKGMTSTGGSVRIGSATTPLRATVQTMSVTGDGPTWAP